MNTTEITRYVLLGALLVVGYLLILAWNDDYGDPARRVDPAAATADPATADPAPAVPDAAPEDGTAVADGGGTEVPSVTGEDVPAAPAAEAAATPREGLVRVRTDTLNVWIDRRGGDLVKLTLPRYPVSLETPDVPFTLLDRRPPFVYVAQSGLAGDDGVDARIEGRPLYSAPRDEFQLAPGEDSLVVPLTFTDERGVTFEKRWIFNRGDYEVGLEFRVRNPLPDPLQVNLYGQIKRTGGYPPGFDPPGMGPRPYVGPAFTTDDSRYEKIDFDDLEDEWRQRVEGGWLAMLEHYFLTAWIPADRDDVYTYRGRQAGSDTYIVEFIGPGTLVPGGDTATLAASFYGGPKIQDRLEEIADNLNLTVDYGFLWWLAVPLFQLLDMFHDLVGNWGVAIILLTLLVKVVLYPLSAASYRSMANMRKVAPEMKRLQERHGDDRQKLSQEMMKLYQKEKINPLGGCLPMLLQMPVFLALYWVLYESVELRQAPFFLWIDDLSSIDPFFVLPLLMGATMFLQMRLNPAPPDPMQARVMKIMPVMFTVLFLFFPAGLVLYWLTNNVLSIAQQWWITRQIEQNQASPAR